MKLRRFHFIPLIIAASYMAIWILVGGLAMIPPIAQQHPELWRNQLGAFMERINFPLTYPFFPMGWLLNWLDAPPGTVGLPSAFLYLFVVSCIAVALIRGLLVVLRKALGAKRPNDFAEGEMTQANPPEAVVAGAKRVRPAYRLFAIGCAIPVAVSLAYMLLIFMPRIRSLTEPERMGNFDVVMPILVMMVLGPIGIFFSIAALIRREAFAGVALVFYAIAAVLFFYH